MRNKLRVLVCAALCVALGSGTAFAGITINGKTLQDIDDIVMETTGSRIVNQESFLRVYKNSDNDKFGIIAVKGNDSGSLDQTKTFNLSATGERTNTGAHPAVGTRRDSDGNLYLMIPSASDKDVKASLYKVGIDGNSNLTLMEVWSNKSVADGDVYVNDAAGGLFPYGKDGKEVFVIAYFTSDDHQRPGLGWNYTSYIAFVDTDGNVSTQHLGVMKSHFPSVRVVVGDFDQDGTNELAVIRDGSQQNYYMQVFKIDSTLSLNNPIYSIPLGSRDSNNVEGCDIVAGDFNGDGHTDLAAIYGSMSGDDGYPAVNTFKWNGSGFDTQYAMDTNEALMIGSQSTFGSSHVPHFGIIGEAGDLNGDGKDEIVFLTASYENDFFSVSEGGAVLASVWGADNNDLTPSRITWKNTGIEIFGYGGVSGVDVAECSYLQRSLSLALVPVGDKLSTGASIRRVFFSRCQGEDTVPSINYDVGDVVYYMTPTLSGSSLTGLGDTVEYNPGRKGRMMGLVHTDFYCQSMELGDPTHMVYEAERSYVAEVQTPPYHVDYVQVPFAVNDNVPTAPSVLNMTYRGSNVVYSKSQKDGELKDTSFKTTDTMEWGVDASAKVSLVPVEAKGGFKNTATKVENVTQKSEVEINFTVTDTTETGDIAVLYKSDRHVWRYPATGVITGRPENSNGDCFMTFSLCDTPSVSNGAVGQSSEFDDYNPIHEEGNLFSYPTKIENIPYYGDRQYDLSNEQDKTVDGIATFDLTVSENGAVTNGTTTTSKKALNGSTSVSIPIPKIIDIGTSTTASYSNELTNTETFTKSYLASEKFTVSLKGGTVGFDNNKVQHTIKTQLYSDAAGVMKVGFAVDLKSTNGDTAQVWQEGGMYYGKPDPALVLPARFVLKTSSIDNVTRAVWGKNDTRKSAIQLRGIWFKDEDGNVVSSALVRGKKYMIEIPVYNASFTAPDRDVSIEMQLRKVRDTDDGHKENDEIIIPQIATKSFSIKGWTKDTEDNKAKVEFEWTVPESLAADNYDLYFVIDPEKNIPEFHENWDYDKDPGGNNVGFYPIAVLEKEPEVYATGTASIASPSESDFKLLFRPVDKDDSREWLTFDEFRAELANTDDDFRAHAKVVYSGSETLVKLYLDVFRLDPDGTEARVATRFIPALFPNTEREVSFMVSPEKIKSGKFSAGLAGHGVKLSWGDNGSSNSSSSSGCNAGLASVALLALPCAFLFFKRKN